MAKLSLHWSYLYSAKLFPIWRDFNERILLFLSKEYELCNVEHYENWWITPIGIPVYIVDIQRVHSCGTCIWFLHRTSFTILCDFWLWNALRLCFCGCFQKLIMKWIVMKIGDWWWSVCWILRFIRIGNIIGIIDIWNKRCVYLIQVLDGDVFQIFDAFLADGLYLEIGQVDDQSLLDFFNAGSH